MTGRAEQISGTMRAAIAYMEKNGDMVRFPGGFWARASWAFHEPCFGTSTINSLVSRGLADYCAWKDGRGGRFPIRACLSARALAAHADTRQEHLS